MVSTKSSVAPPAEPSSTASAVFNMINAVLGAGIVSLPYAWAKAGFILGWIMFVVTAIGTCYTLEVLIYIAVPLHEKGEISVIAYEVLAERILGIWGRRMILASQFLYAFGIAVGYVVIIHDEFPTAMSQLTGAGFFDHEILNVLIVAFGLLLPMSLLRSVAGLAKMSFFCFLTAIIINGLVLYERFTSKSDLCEGSSGSGSCDEAWSTFAKSSALSVYGIFVFTKACHHTQFQIYRSLGDGGNPERWSWICRLAIVLCSAITSGCAMTVYSTFGEGVESDFFKSYWKDSKVVSAGRLTFAGLIMMGFPMQLFVCRETLQVIVVQYLEERKKAKELIPTEEEGIIQQESTSLIAESAAGVGREATSPMLHYSTTFFLFFLVLGTGISTDSLGAVLSLVGGTAGSTIAFLAPGLICYRCEEVTGLPAPGGKHLGLGTAIFGVCTILITSIFTFV
eukprot:TRINITY_DN7820_c1_g1_i1.p1 TRINITY_DN7820_c1_g1~~TRINITY_DN7820_c1_g1_i1.p1  ORF type:complete len:512 (+),score=69.60 TRINITY_DN7820_c1_g1_i1:179-1537(+)